MGAKRKDVGRGRDDDWLAARRGHEHESARDRSEARRARAELTELEDAQRDAPSVGAEGRRRDTVVERGDPLGRGSSRESQSVEPRVALIVALGDESERVARGREDRHIVVRGVRGDLAHFAGGEIEQKHIVVARTIRGESDEAAVGRERGLSIVSGALGKGDGGNAGLLDRPDVPRPVPVRLEDDALASTSHVRQTVVAERVGHRFRLAPLRGEAPERSLEIEDEAAVGRERGGEIRALAEGHPDLLGVGERPEGAE